MPDLPHAEVTVVSGRFAVVADDDVQMRSLVAAMLRGLGFAILELSDGLALVEYLRKSPRPTLIVTDLHMPGFTGLQAIRYIRRLGLDTPAILVTAFGNPRIHVEATRLGATAVLDKPFGLDALRALVIPFLQSSEEPKAVSEESLPDAIERRVDGGVRDAHGGGTVLRSRKALVLLVDDCVETREMYAEFLSPSFEIAQAATAGEALTKASELRPSVIVMDLMLPDMGGEDAIFSLRRDARTERIPVVVLSGFTEPKQKSQPWNAYLVKPCHPDALSACLDRMIGQAVP